MILKLSSPLWGLCSLLFALAFITWASILVWNVAARQAEVAARVQCISNLSDLEDALRELDQVRAERLPGAPPEREDPWQRHTDTVRRLAQSAQATEKADAALLSFLVQVEQSVDQLTELRRQLVQVPREGPEYPLLVEAFRGVRRRGVDVIREAVRNQRGRLRELSLDLSGKWQQLNYLVFVSCGLAILSTILAFVSQRALLSVQRVKAELQQASEQLEQRVKERTHELAREVGDRKLAEQALRESESQFRAIFELAAAGIVQVEPGTGRFLRVNDCFAAITGFTPEALLQKTFADLTCPEDRAADLEQFQRMVAGEVSSYQAEKRYVRRDGQEIWVQVTTALIRDAAGRPARTIGVVHELTARKRTEAELRKAREELELTVQVRTADLVIANNNLQQKMEQHAQAVVALRESEAKYHSLVENLPMCVYRKDREGRIVSANRKWCETRGLPMESLLGRTVFDWFPPDLAEKYTQDDRRVLETGEVFHAIEEHLAGSGERLFVEVIKTAVRDHRGQIIGTQGAFWDVTQKHLAKEALQRTHEELERRVAERTLDLERSNRELARSNQELQQFAYIASHDLQEPLRAVAGCVTLLQQYCGPALDDRASAYIRLAVDGANRMQELILDLLSYSRVGWRGHQVEETDCNTVISTVLSDLAAGLQQCQAEVHFLPLPTVLADRTELSQLFQNLLTNAIKFRGPEVPRIRVGAVLEESTWHFSVADNGIGIEPQYAERVFGVFQRLHTRREYPGTGIGLAICKKIVERHGGRIWVESIPGHGTTFHFTLPSRR